MGAVSQLRFADAACCRRLACAIAMLVVAIGMAPGAWLDARQDDRVASREDLDAWVVAVERHVPGEFDGPAFEVAAWEQARLERVLVSLLDLVKDAQKQARRAAADRRPSTTVPDVTVARLGLAPDALVRGDATRFLERAAVLHTDIASMARGRMPMDTAGAMRAGHAGSVTVLDGRFGGYSLHSDHWGFARRVLDRVRPSPQVLPVVTAWYRAVAAHFISRASYGELGPHLDEGRQLLPRDAVLAMMAGAQHQALASPRVQAALATLVVPPGKSLAVGTRDAELRLARRAYEVALTFDAGLVEARIRLARVLADLGLAAEAAAALRSSASAAGELELQYLAALFLGEQEMRLNRMDDARTSFERACALYPRAQSPLLSLSLLARAQGNRDGALEALARVTRLPQQIEPGDDPWWAFHTSPGRHAAAAMADVRTQLAEGRP